MRFVRVRPILSIAIPFALATGCAKPPLSVKDIRPGASLVIAKAYEESQLNQRRRKLFVVFRSFSSPGRPDAFGFVGSSKNFSADDALPGRYHFSKFDNYRVIYVFEPHNQRFEVEVGPGEAVYIGDIVELHANRRFRIVVRDNTEAARAFFQEKFASSGLVFTKRLLKRVRRLDPQLPR